MKRVALEMRGISHKERAGLYFLLLGEAHSRRTLPVVIGATEAYGIYCMVHDHSLPRPSCQEFVYHLMQGFHLDLVEVFVAAHKEGVYFADIHCVSEKKQLVLDARCSDAVLLALQFGRPIFTTEEMMAKYGVELEDEPDDKIRWEDAEESAGEVLEEEYYDSEEEEEAEEEAEEAPGDSLQHAIERAIAEENYELAAKLYKKLKGQPPVS